MSGSITAHHRRGRTRVIRPLAVTSLVLGLVVVAPQTSATATEPGAAPETAALLEAGRVHLQNRADLVTASADTARVAHVQVAMTAPMAAGLQQEAVALSERGDLLESVNGGYRAAEVSVTPEHVYVNGDQAVVDLIEDTKLYFPTVVAGEPEYEEYSLPHTLTYTRNSASGSWLLSKDVPKVDPNGPAPTTQFAEPAPVPFKEPPFKPNPAEQGPNPPEPPQPEPPKGVPPASAAGGPASGTDPKVSAGGGAPAPMSAAASYNYTAMANYADRYWRNHNGSYRTYSSDCTNFISQAMRAGGWGTTSGSASSRADNRKWFYGSFSWTTSYTWAGAENWWWFASRHSGRTYMLNSPWSLGMADVLQADWDRNDVVDHTMIVTAVGGSERYLTYRSNSTHNRKLSSLLASNPHAWFYPHRT
ncbi:amidase domain-containing protein [Streptomyces virginiae]|uniref:amidase domain-containing protein n=1 Tax=Streptomyces virginiae TaxID=1961 RepID=UPI00364F457D